MTSADLSFDSWQVADLRLTAFPVRLYSEGMRWAALVGQKPETSASKDFDNDIEEGGLVPLGGKLTYRRSPRVIQWMLEGIATPDRPAAPWLAHESLSSFHTLMRRWLADCPALQRLGLGAALYLPVRDRPEAYERLEGLLHLGLKYSDEEGDFVYQYNRRRPSQTVPEVKVNRLGRWTWTPLGEVQIRDGQLVFPRESACVLELDVNTAPEFPGALPPDRYLPLFEELVRLAAEVATHGDVP